MFSFLLFEVNAPQDRMFSEENKLPGAAAAKLLANTTNTLSGDSAGSVGLGRPQAQAVALLLQGG